ncbi:MAG: hypothetical protein Q8M10_03045 [Methylotenera sp.]|uniref:hypothetical protein n=1 Tax=Methylotenera sp. TaxID=2051956 RepID=UPI00272EF866|nr:hypothetical protein [Methylotenera sp.]MDP1522107.1 hypothetical protein [Methylotenera sp.]
MHIKSSEKLLARISYPFLKFLDKNDDKPAKKLAWSGPRIPPESSHIFSDGTSFSIQITHCKNPNCANFGIIPKSKSIRGRKAEANDTYQISGIAPGESALACKLCGKYTTIKSNAGIAEELARLSEPLAKKQPVRCPDMSCINSKQGWGVGSDRYTGYGKTKSGNQRYKCKSCAKIFAVKASSTDRQKKTEVNRKLFEELVNKTPFSRIVHKLGISWSTFYGKIDFLHRQCVAFAGHREAKFKTLKLKRLYLSTDRQDYTINWLDRSFRKNVILHGIGTADNTTGYVFGMHVNYDSEMDKLATEANALVEDDYSKPQAFRKYARVWLVKDYEKALLRSDKSTSAKTKNMAEVIRVAQAEADEIEILKSDQPEEYTTLPATGLQIHAEYTMFGHFFYLKKLIGHVEKLRFYLDRDSGIESAFMAAFIKEVKNHSADAFYVKIAKNLFKFEKMNAVTALRRVTTAYQKEHEVDEWTALMSLMLNNLNDPHKVTGSKEFWYSSPLISMTEPEKELTCLTNDGRFDFLIEDTDTEAERAIKLENKNHFARLLMKGTLHGIDRFFMQIRRMLSPLERPIGSASSVGRSWYGYAPYNPSLVQKLLDIYRTYYNYCKVGKDGKTPAIRLGVAKAVVTLEDIIYYK